MNFSPFSAMNVLTRPAIVYSSHSDRYVYASIEYIGISSLLTCLCVIYKKASALRRATEYFAIYALICQKYLEGVKLKLN